MPFQNNSEQKLTRKQIRQGYTYDNSDTEESPLKKVLIAAAIGAFGIGAYKSGALKTTISGLIDYAGKSKNTAPATMSAFKSWSISNDDFQKSILRNGFRENIANAFKGETNVSKNIRNIANETIDDFKSLKEKSREYVEGRLEKSDIYNKLKYVDTDINKQLNKIDLVSERYEGRASEKAKEIMRKDLYKKYMLSEEDKITKLKRTGYRPITLGDIFNPFIDEEQGFATIMPNGEYFKLERENTEKIKDFIRNIDALDKDGKKILNRYGRAKNLLETGDYKNIIIDRNILISETGELSDMRDNLKDFQGFIRSAANDFKVPFVGINPLKFFGLGDLGADEKLFETISTNTIQPGISGKIGNTILRDIDGFDNKRLLFSNGNVLKYDNEIQDFVNVKSGMTLKKHSNNGYVNKQTNNYAKMANLKTAHYEEYTKADGNFKYYKGKLSKFLDIGRQDSKAVKYDGFYNTVTPNNVIESLSGKAFKKMNFTKSQKMYDVTNAFGELEEYNKKIEEQLYVAIKKHIKWKDVMDPLNNANIREYFSQFMKGRKNIDEVTESSITVYNLFERMNQAFKPFGLALGLDSIGSTKDVISNMLLKRFLPVYGAIQGVEYLTYLSESDEEDKSGSSNLKQKVATNVARIELGATKIKDAVGLTDLFKSMKESVPGVESLTELPGVKNLGLERNYEEQKQWYQTGMEPVRKGRYWDLGNTAFIGGKVNYYQPNWYRQIMGDANFSENKWGSRKEYFENAWFPTPTSPLAPIRHFITDRYHYEEKHYYDRPYLLTSPQFENVPLAGNILSSTVGQLIKPQKKMHEEYWNGPYGTNTLNKDSFYIPYDESAEGNDNTILEDSFDISEGQSIAQGNLNYKRIEYKGSKLGVVPQNISDDGKEIYITNSGNLGFIDIDREKLQDIKYKIRKTSPKSMLGVNTAPNRETLEHQKGTAIDGQFYNEDGEPIINPNSIANSIGDQYMDTTNVLGLYGYLTNTYVTGDIGAKQDVIETSGYAYSFNDSFWDKNLGGLGGDVSEIFRRFVQKRRNDVDYYNPIRNTQPNWMPGQNYFQNFKVGDPFNKVPNGELRLAGTPYEKIWGIRDPLELGIGSSFLGKSKDEIVAHYLQDDTITDEGLVDIVETGTKMHEAIEEEWLKDGLAIDAEGKIEDDENRIIGYYDAKIHDPTSKTGVAMVDIKTISDKGFQEIVATGQAKDSHRRQVNYYLWASDNDKGYVHYVNRDNPDQRYTVGFKYSQELLEDSFKNLEDARNEVLDMYESGQISRGDLYKPIDRFRILADVAPWSQEFTEMDNVLRASGMDEATKKQYDEIKDRVKVQKQPHNTYEYRYKNAEVESVSTKVTKVRGNDIYTEFSGDKAIKLAGLNLGVEGTAAEKHQIEDITKNIQEGSSIKLLVDADEVRRRSGSMKAVVIDDKGTNINKELLNQGVAEEDKDDWSAPSVHARYSKNQIMFGSIWERIAHFDSPINTKLLQVRSAKEDYERREVYGKDFASWQHPIRDFLKPAVYSAINRPSGILFGAILGGLFGKNKFGRTTGAVVGMGAVIAGKLAVGLQEVLTGERWIPEPIEKERELVKYMDTLKFIKNQRLYDYYKKRSLEEEGFDLDEYEAKKEEQAKIREATANKYKKQKVNIKERYENAMDKRDEYIENNKPTRHKDTGNEFIDKVFDTKEKISKFFYDRKSEKLTEEAKEAKEEFRAINKKINGVEDHREIEVLPDFATKALEYKENAEKTLYGYDVGEPLTNLLAALPKIDRDRMKYFLKAPEEEREELLEIVPDYVRRALQSNWGMEVDEKPNLEQYFKTHQLPDTDWIGWNENVDMDSIKVKMINREGLDYSDFNVWDDDVENAENLGPVPLPSINFKNNATTIKRRLNKLLNSIGVEDVRIDYTFTDSNANLDLNLQYDSKEEIEKKINNSNVYF